MPEGDNIHAHAAQLAALIGTPLVAVWSKGVDMRGLRKESLTATEAVGKHLLLAFSEGTGVRVHLGIAGWWRFAKAPSPAILGQAHLALVTSTGTWHCKAKTIEWSRARFAKHARAIQALGPDLLATPNLDEVLRRAREPLHAARSVGELLLDQRIASGLGNVYKCELLFLHRLDPWRRVDSLDDTTLRALFTDGIKWLSANVGRSRTTTADLSTGERPARGLGRYWVYGRWRRPCYVCGTPVEQRRQKPSLRPTYHCPSCQPAVVAIAGSTPEA